MPSTSFCAREARMRRLAAKFGLRLTRSRRHCDRGNYALVDIYINGAVFGFGVHGYDADLDDIEEYLTAY